MSLRNTEDSASAQATGVDTTGEAVQLNSQTQQNTKQSEEEAYEQEGQDMGW